MQIFTCAGSALLHHLHLIGWLPYTGNAGKKWENTIKVDSEKGPVTLKKWLNSTGVDKARKLGALKGRTIWVLWPDENAFYRGKVTGFNPDKGLHHVDYDYGTSLAFASSSCHICASVSAPSQSSNLAGHLVRLCSFSRLPSLLGRI